MPLASDKRLSDEEFEDVVEEIAKSQVAAGEGLSAEDAKKALQELDLPADKLDEATAAVRQRREALALQKAKRTRLMTLAAVAVAVLVSLVVGVAMMKQARVGKLARITASDPVLSEEPGGQLRLSTKLMNAPKGEAIPMSCTWRGPDGALIHENAWQTKPVTHDAWETHCVFQKAPEHVKVEMKAHDRVVAESSR